jgi:phenylpropionate dioxygenase-like ring-hydroxylating dioxygenase large terminal subunit
VIRVTYVLGCHDHRYSQHFKLQTVDGAQQLVDVNMAKDRFSIEVAGGYIWIYPNKVSAIEIRDITTEENIRKGALEAQRKGV